MKKRITILFSTLLTTTMLLSVVPAVNAADINETKTQPTTVVEPVDAKPTTITLKKNSKTLYIKGKYTIKPTVKNGVGKTTYKTSNKKIVTVTNAGVVTAKKKGNATISVVNNGVVAQLKVVVKEPSLNINKTTIAKGKSFKIKIKGVVGKATFKSSKSSVAKVDKNGKVTAKKKGKAAIIIKTNGNVKLKCNVTVKNPTKWDLVKYKVTFKKLKDNITVNLGEPSIKLVDFFEVGCNDNIADLLNKGKITYKQSVKFQKRLDKDDKTVYFKLADSSLGKLSKTNVKWDTGDVFDVNLTSKKKGSTILKIQYKNKTLSYKYTVTKHNEFTFKDKKSLAVYNSTEAIETIKSELFNRYAEGQKAKYSNIVCYFNAKNIYDKIEDSIEKINIKTLSNYKPYFDEIDFLSLYEVKKYNYSNGNYIYYLKNNILDMDYDYVAYEKNLYDEAYRIIKDYKVNDYTNDYDKIIALSKWFDEECVYDYEKVKNIDNGKSEQVENLILTHKGICSDYASTTEYFCKLLNIPCKCVSYKKGNHSWNIIKIQGKWYHLDILWNLYFMGNDNINKQQNHTSNFDEITKSEYKTINIEDEDFLLSR